MMERVHAALSPSVGNLENVEMLLLPLGGALGAGVEFSVGLKGFDEGSLEGIKFVVGVDLEDNGGLVFIGDDGDKLDNDKEKEEEEEEEEEERGISGDETEEDICRQIEAWSGASSSYPSALSSLLSLLTNLARTDDNSSNEGTIADILKCIPVCAAYFLSQRIMSSLRSRVWGERFKGLGAITPIGRATDLPPSGGDKYKNNIKITRVFSSSPGGTTFGIVDFEAVDGGYVGVSGREITVDSVHKASVRNIKLDFCSGVAIGKSSAEETEERGGKRRKLSKDYENGADSASDAVGSFEEFIARVVADGFLKCG